MPVFSEGRWRAVLSDYLTDQIPGPTSPRWGFPSWQGVKAERVTSSFSQTVFRDAIFGTRTDRLTAIYGCPGANFSNFGQTASAFSLDGQVRDTVKATAEARATLLGYSVGTWQNETADLAYSSGPSGETHFVDTGEWNRTASNAAFLAAFRTAGTNGFQFDPVANWQSEVSSYLAARISGDGWRFAVVQPETQQVLPLANRSNVSFTNPPVGLFTEAARAMVVNDTHFYVPRQAGNPNGCAWTKLLAYKKYATPGATSRPAIITGEGAVERKTRVYPILREATGRTFKWHFATVDGSESPGTNAAADALLGVTDDADWSIWGIDGLRNKPAADYFTWAGRVDKALRLTIVEVPADLTPIGLSTLDELLDVAGVDVAAQWELWPESDIGPAFSLRVPCETVTADMALASGLRLRAEAGYPNDLAVIDGGMP